MTFCYDNNTNDRESGAGTDDEKQNKTKYNKRISAKEKSKMSYSETLLYEKMAKFRRELNVDINVLMECYNEQDGKCIVCWEQLELEPSMAQSNLYISVVPWHDTFAFIARKYYIDFITYNNQMTKLGYEPMIFPIFYKYFGYLLPLYEDRVKKQVFSELYSAFRLDMAKRQGKVLSILDIAKIFMNFDYKCYICNSKMNFNMETTDDSKRPALSYIDKTKPTAIDNIVPICKMCSKAKNAKSLLEYKAIYDQRNKTKMH